MLSHAQPVPDITRITNPEIVPEPESIPVDTLEIVPANRSWWSVRGPRVGARPWLYGFVAVFAILLVSFIAFYLKFARLTDEKLGAGVFADTVNIYAAPAVIAVGDHHSQGEVVTGYAKLDLARHRSIAPDATKLARTVQESTLPATPPLAQEPAVIYFSGDHISRIVTPSGTTIRQYQFAPRLITNQSDRNREKRRLVQFSEIPPALVDAVVSVEDKHFFSHSGFDLFRMFKAAYVDVREGRKQQGASTLSMQLARGLWLQPDKKWKRKFAEALITMHLERKLTKKQIFAFYCNQVYLGRQGTFSINGFGEAAHSYFDKDISQLSTPEAALLAGLVQRPSYYNPFRYPVRARERRDVVLRLMHDNRRLTDLQYRAALETPVKLSPAAWRTSTHNISWTWLMMNCRTGWASASRRFIPSIRRLTRNCSAQP